MCTVSWIHSRQGYQLLCNRDEKRTRAQAVGPRVRERGGVRYIAPADGDFGGSWIAVNEFGLSLCLLNGPAREIRATRSRGLLLRELIWSPDAAESLLGLRQLDLTLYAPFTLLALEPAGARLAQWDGAMLTVMPSAAEHMPLTSSSVDPEGVRRARLNDLAGRVSAAGRLDSAVLHDFHSAHGACMHRGDAETVSFSQVTVSAAEVRFFYSPAAPCYARPGEHQILRRAA